MHRVKVLSILLLMFSGIVFSSRAQIVRSDSLALVALYDSTDGANWKNTWDLNQSVSNWYGITVSGDRVTQIHLYGNQLNGHLPPQLGDLSALTSMEISANSNLTGNIPDEIGNLKELTSLALQFNKLSGEIPRSLLGLSQLTVLYLNNNQLSGTIPAGIDSLKELSALYLSINDLTGTIPASIANLSHLKVLYLHANELEGDFPVFLTTMTQLQRLLLYSNHLTGTIPEEIGNLTNLTHLGLGFNQLTGGIPASIGNLTNLTYLKLNLNQLTGSIPPEFWRLTKLKYLYLNNNQLSGTISDSLGNLVNLVDLYLDNNGFTGTIPAGLDSLTSLRTFKIGGNNFNGAVPEALTRLTGLHYLDFWANQLNHLPDFSALPNLTYLNVQSNRLTFADLEPQTHSQSLTSFSYGGQAAIGRADTLWKAVGDSLRISQNAGGTVTHYQWQKDGQDIAGLTDSVLRLSDLQRKDTGLYGCKMTNDSLPLLTLYSYHVTVNVTETGDITSDTTWSAGDTIYISGDVYVSSGVRLTIEPGAVVLFTGHHSLHIQGTLSARGTPTDSIIFTAAKQDSGWQGIYFKPIGYNPDTSYIEYCRLEYANPTFPEDSLYNGAISSIDYQHLQVRHSLFTHNRGKQGGAFHSEDGEHEIENNTFVNNNATHGGAIFSSGTSLELNNNTFRTNSASFGGAVFCADRTWGFLNGNYIENNQSTKNGGAVYASESNLNIHNDVYVQNTAGYGGAISTTYSGIELTNCTISDNNAHLFGGAMYITFSSSAGLANSILWNNTADSSGNEVYFFGTGTEGEFQYCDIQGDSSGFVGPVESLTYSNNMALDPLFSEADVEPYRLGENSPCLDAGAPDSADIWVPETDIAGNSRVQNGRIDMGAYEGAYTTGIGDSPENLPQTAQLYANYPNPFGESQPFRGNPSTTIAYDINRGGRVQLKVYNALGQLVKKVVDERQKPGRYQLHFRAKNLASGIYFYQLKIGSFIQTRKMILLH